MRAVSNQVCSSSLNNSKFCLEILKEKPEVLDLLFDCTILSRSTSYPQSRINSSAYEVIALFLRWPSYVVPGVPTLGDPTLDTQYWKVLMQCMRIMTSRKDWADKIMESWMRIEEEGYDQISTYGSLSECQVHTSSSVLAGCSMASVPRVTLSKGRRDRFLKIYFQKEVRTNDILLDPNLMYALQERCV